MPQAVSHGDHICVVYDTEEEQLTVAAEYVNEGLWRGDRCFYVGESAASLDRFHQALARLGVDAAEMIRFGALVESTKAEAHLAGGRFDVERMMALLDEAVRSATADGFRGLRTCGDMSWLLDNAPGTSRLAEYEAQLNPFFERVAAAGMCQYNRWRLPPETIDHALATHSSAVVDGRYVANPFYESPDTAAWRLPRLDDLQWKLMELRLVEARPMRLA